MRDEKLTWPLTRLSPLPGEGGPLVFWLCEGGTDTGQLVAGLQEGGYVVHLFATFEAFRAEYPAKTCPDVVVIDLVSVEGLLESTRVLTELQDAYTVRPPVVLLSNHDGLRARLASLRAGVKHYLVKPVASEYLLDRLDELTRRQPPAPYRVLRVGADPQQLAADAALLRTAGMVVETLADPLYTLEQAEIFAPDVFVLDVDMPTATGPELATVLREHEAFRYQPIVFLAGGTEVLQQVLTLELGGDDVLGQPVAPQHLVAVITARARRYRSDALLRQRLQHMLYEREREHLALDQHAIVSITDGAGRIVYVNQKFCDTSGYTREELLGQDHRIIKSGEHPPAFYAKMWTTLAQERVWRGEICNRRKDGSLYWVDSTITPFFDADGLPYQYISIRTDITALKEQAVRLRLQASAMESSVNGIVIADARADDLPLIYVNPAFERMSGYAAAEVLGRNCSFLQGEERAQPALEEVRAALREARPTTVLLRNYRKSGELFWNELTLAPVRDEEGAVTHFIGVSNDVTVRKRAEEAALAHRERLRRGQMYANIGTWDWNIQTGELFWTERIGPLFGYPEGELETSYENFLNAVHPDDRQAVIDAVNACVERDVPYEIEHRVVWPDGTVRWLLERGAVVRDGDGRPMQMLGVVQDIDDRKQAELALAERERELREAQALARIGNWVANLETGALIWSDEIYRIFGHAPGSFEPSVAAFHAAVHPDDRASVQASEARAARTGRHDVVHRIVRPDGTVRHVHELAEMECDEAGNPLRMRGTVQDVTERVEAEQALIALSEEAERANRAKSDFLSSMSHELRTPMNAILGFAQLLEYDTSLPGEHLDSVREILKAGRHLLDLINEVLDLAKVESGNIDLSLEPVEVCPVVDECIGLMTALADQRGIALSHDGLAGAAVRADRVRLKQALLNLLSNAIKYNRPGGSVRLDVRRSGEDRVRLRVTDTGPGIAPARMKDLFQPFNRLGAEHGTIEGTGIGLTITQRLVEMMGGAVGAESEVGVGSTFWIELPLESVPGEVAATRGDVGHDAGLAVQPVSVQHTVLYIEDNPSNLKLVAQILGRRPHLQLLTAHTPELGIEMARARRPDLILLDINLPGMDGYQVLQILKADPQTRAIPAIAISANAMPSDVERGRAAGFVDYLTKPLDIPGFLGLLDRCLGTPQDSHP